MNQIDTSKLLTPKQAADRASVDEKTVRRWVAEGRLSAKRRGGPRGHLFIDPTDLDSMYREAGSRGQRTGVAE